MTRNRLEAFSDGVIAILITIMVLELTVPGRRVGPRGAPAGLWACARLPQLRPQLRLPGHLLEQPPPPAACDRAGDGRRALGQHAPALLALADAVRHGAGWARTSFAATPTAVYGVVLLMAAVAYFILVRAIIHSQGDGLAAGAGGRERPQGQDLGRPVCGVRSRSRSSRPGRPRRSTSGRGVDLADLASSAVEKAGMASARTRRRSARTAADAGGAGSPRLRPAGLLQREPDPGHGVVAVAAPWPAGRR